jgi:RNA polymerase sigma-70 factor (ECF subfamily)
MSDHDEYQRLIQPIERQMVGAVWRVVRNEDDFDEAFQEATLKIWKHLGKIRRHPNPHALILRICINAAYDVLRRRIRIRRRELLDTMSPEPASPLPNGTDDVEARHKRDQLLAAIAGLPPKQARSVLLRYMEGLSYEEVAAALGCREATARVHVSRACRKLRELLPHPADCG